MDEEKPLGKRIIEIKAKIKEAEENKKRREKCKT